jgi:hypothetical protein
MRLPAGFGAIMAAYIMIGAKEGVDAKGTGKGGQEG